MMMNAQNVSWAEAAKLEGLMMKLETDLQVQELKQEQKKKGKEIYCGDEETANFLIDALGQLNINAECEIFTCDGEYHVQVKI